MTNSNGNHPASERITIPARAPVDLHLHTLASDGAWTPSALIDHLAGRGFRVVAVCDHDTQRSVVQAIELGKLRGVHVIPGVEITCGWNDRQLHILCYGVRPDRTDNDSKAFRELLNRIDLQLQENAADAARRIEADGKPLPNLDEVRAGRPLWPFHVLTAAIEMKHVPNLTKAAELVVALGGTFTADLPLGEVVAATHQAGGVCSIAHPGRATRSGSSPRKTSTASWPKPAWTVSRRTIAAIPMSKRRSTGAWPRSGAWSFRPGPIHMRPTARSTPGPGMPSG